MKKINFTLACLVALTGIIACSCTKSEEEAPLESLEQTLWEGTLTDSDSAVIPLSVAFTYETHGYYVIAGDPTGFNYKDINGKIINISDTRNDLFLTGEWWVLKITQEELILKEHPLEETRTKTLTLKRIEAI